MELWTIISAKSLLLPKSRSERISIVQETPSWGESLKNLAQENKKKVIRLVL